MKIKNLSRFSAFGSHLIFSSLIACLSSIIVFIIWYPGFLSYASGVAKIFLLLLAVDVTIGPLITLIIFNRQKKELRRDIIIVLLVQIIALLYGLHTVFITRPVYIVFNANRFDLVYANDLTEKNIKKARSPEFKSLPYFGPKVIAALLPNDPKIAAAIVMSAATGNGEDVQDFPEYYTSYQEQRTNVIKHTRPLSALKFINPKRIKEIDDLYQKYKIANIEAGYIPLKAKLHDLVVILDHSTGKVLEISDFKPWK